MTIIKRELRRGLEITESIMVGKRPWHDLFVKHTFFTADYKYYISVTTASKDKEAHRIWSGYVESKVRMLVQKLEMHPSIALAHAFNKGYERRHRCQNDEEIEQVQEGSLKFLVEDNSVKMDIESRGRKEDVEGQQPLKSTDIFTTTHYIGLQLDKGECDTKSEWPFDA